MRIICTHVERTLKLHLSANLLIWVRAENYSLCMCLLPGARCAVSWLSLQKTYSPHLTLPWNQRQYPKTVMWNSPVSYQVGLQIPVLLCACYCNLFLWGNWLKPFQLFALWQERKLPFRYQLGTVKTGPFYFFSNRCVYYSWWCSVVEGNVIITNILQQLSLMFVVAKTIWYAYFQIVCTVFRLSSTRTEVV